MNKINNLIGFLLIFLLTIGILKTSFADKNLDEEIIEKLNVFDEDIDNLYIKMDNKIKNTEIKKQIKIKHTEITNLIEESKDKIDKTASENEIKEIYNETLKKSLLKTYAGVNKNTNLMENTQAELYEELLIDNEYIELIQMLKGYDLKFWIVIEIDLLMM